MTLKIKWVGSPNFRKQTGVDKKFIVLHWMVGSLSGTDRVFQDANRKVATNYGIEENKVHQYVKDEDYAFGSGTTHANKFGISIEHEGGWMQKDGTRKVPTRGTLDTSAQLCAKIAREHKLGKLKLGVNVFPHNHFVATQCPGTLNMSYIVDKANEINAELDAPVAPVTPAPKPIVLTNPAQFHVVQPGEFLSRIAAKYKISLEELVKKNNIKNVNLVFPGQKLLIKDAVTINKPVQKPAPAAPVSPVEPPKVETPKPAPKPVVEAPKTYTVKPNDNLTNIARAHKTTIAVLKKLNGIKNANLIRVGQVIKLP